MGLKSLWFSFFFLVSLFFVSCNFPTFLFVCFRCVTVTMCVFVYFCICAFFLLFLLLFMVRLATLQTVIKHSYAYSKKVVVLLKSSALPQKRLNSLTLQTILASCLFFFFIILLLVKSFCRLSILTVSNFFAQQSCRKTGQETHKQKFELL